MGRLLQLLEADTATKPRLSLLQRLQQEDEAKNPGPLDELGRVARTFGSGVMSLGALVPSAAEYLAEAPVTPWGISELLIPDSLDQGTNPVAEAVAGPARALRQSLERGAALLSPEPLQQSFGQGLRERPVGTLLEGAARMAPQTLAVIGSGLATGGATVPALLGGAMEGLPAYTEARDAGVGTGEAGSLATVQGLISGSLEALGGEAILGRIPGTQNLSRLARYLIGAGVEGGTEVAQEGVDVARQTAEGLPSGNVADRLLAAGTLGALSGGLYSLPAAFSGGHGGATEPSPSQQTDEVSRLRQALDAEVDRRNQLEREANTDPLTGLANRRLFNSIRQEAEADPNRWFVTYDLNHFKAVNDKAGHDAGDAALRDAGTAMRDVLSGNGVAIRLGGDEFVQVVTGSREEAERVRQETERYFGAEDYGGGFPLTLTGSVGETFQAADSRLQDLKRVRKQELGIPLERQITSPLRQALLQDEASQQEGLAPQPASAIMASEPVSGAPSPIAPAPEAFGQSATLQPQQGLLGAASVGAFDTSLTELPTSTSRTAMELPEIVQLSQELLGGQMPGVRRKLLGNASGRFTGNENGASINLKAELFKDPSQAAATLAHEVGHLVDWLPEGTLKRGDVLGHVASLKRYMQGMIDALPTSSSNLLTRQERDGIRRSVKKELGPEASPADISRAYKQAVQATAESRGLLTKERAMGELLGLSEKWRPGLEAADPGSSYGKYRRKPTELYADAVSALFNAPAMAKGHAPTFFRSFEAYLGRKPEVKAAYEAVQQVSAMAPADLVAHRDARVEASLEQGRRARAAQLAAQEMPATPTFSQVTQNLARLVIDKRAAVIRLAKRAAKAGSHLGEEVLRTAKEGDLVNSQVAGYMEGIVREVISPMEAAGVDAETFARWLLYRRAATERAAMANPLGIQGKAAEAQLGALEASLGPERATALREAGDRLADYRQKWVLDPLVQSRALSPAWNAKVLENRNYARFEVQDFITDEAAGRAAGLGSVKSQYGTLKAVGDPLVETVIHDSALIRMRQKAALAQQAIAWLQTDFPELITKAETKFNGRYHEPVPPADRTQGLFTYLRDGAVEGVYIPKDVASALETRYQELEPFLRWWNQRVHGPIRNVLVNFNLAWALRNIPKDLKTSAKNVYRGPGSLLRATQDTATAFRDVWKAGEVRLPEEVDLLRGGAVLPSGFRAWDVADLNDTDALQHLFSRYGVLTEQAHQRKVRHPLFSMLKLVTSRVGEVSERAAKVAAFRYLKGHQEQLKLTDKQVMEWVRDRAGTPNALLGGELSRFTNAIWMFSRINTNGWRASWDSFKNDKAGYVLKTAMYDVAPKLVMLAGIRGLLDGLEEQLGFKPSEVLRRLPRWVLENMLVIPLGLDKNGKGVALTYPHDYMGQAIGSLVWRIGMGMDPAELFDWVQNQLPWGGGSLHPAITAVGMAGQYLAGKNPYDDWRGDTLINDRVFQAGGWRSHLAMGRALWNELGGKVVWNFPTKTEGEALSYLEKLTQLPWVGSALQSFVRVSDAGLSEESRDKLEDVRSREAAAGLAKDDAIRKALVEAHGGQVDIKKLYQQMKDDGLDPGRYAAFRRRVEVIKIRTFGSRMERERTYMSKSEAQALEEN